MTRTNNKIVRSLSSPALHRIESGYIDKRQKLEKFNYRRLFNQDNEWVNLRPIFSESSTCLHLDNNWSEYDVATSDSSVVSFGCLFETLSTMDLDTLREFRHCDECIEDYRCDGVIDRFLNLLNDESINNWTNLRPIFTESTTSLHLFDTSSQVSIGNLFDTVTSTLSTGNLFLSTIDSNTSIRSTRSIDCVECGYPCQFVSFFGYPQSSSDSFIEETDPYSFFESSLFNESIDEMFEDSVIDYSDITTGSITSCENDLNSFESLRNRIEEETRDLLKEIDLAIMKLVLLRGEVVRLL